MEKTGDEAAAKFINALIKSVQTLCHGYLEFQNGIEIIGHINLNVDKGSSLDYILKEKVCKNAENSTLFISNSFHAEPKPEQEVPGKQTGNRSQTVQNCEGANTGGSTKVSSAISSISSALTGIRERRHESFGAKDSESSHSHHRTAKRKASSDQSGVCAAKVSTHHDGSHLSSDSPYHPNSSSPIDSKLGLQELADGVSSETLLPQTASVMDHTDIGVNLAGSVLEPVENQSNADLAEREEDSDGDLEVTFIKEEYVEGDRSACEFDDSSQQYVGGPHDRNSEGMVDSSVFPVSLHSSSAPSTYVPSAHDPGAVGQQFSGGVPSQPQPGPSGTRGSDRDRQRCGGLSKPAPLGDFLHSTQQSVAQNFRTPAFLSETFHQFSASNSKVLKCSYCEAIFPSYAGLLGHTNSVHLNRQQYVCDICGKGFSQSEHYNDHMNMHNNVKAHHCTNCFAAFTYKTNLRRHLRSGVCSRKYGDQVSISPAGDLKF